MRIKYIRRFQRCRVSWSWKRTVGDSESKETRVGGNELENSDAEVGQLEMIDDKVTLMLGLE